jgi:uncharacterized protein (DUF2236 family)
LRHRWFAAGGARAQRVSKASLCAFVSNVTRRGSHYNSAVKISRFARWRSINQKHQKVHGVLKTQAGPFAAGTPYDANDPELKLWVLATITDSTLLVYDSFVSRLTDDDCESYYADNLRVAELFGIPSSITPQNYKDFRVYFDRMMAGEAIHVSDEARDIADALFARTPSGLLLFAGSALSLGLLPERLHDEFGFGSRVPAARSWKRIPNLCRSLRRFTPSVLCAHPVATLSQLLLPSR